MKSKLHNIAAIPEGMVVGDILPAFAGVQHHFYIGAPDKVCACCVKSFTSVRRPRRIIRLYPFFTRIPFACQYLICGKCFAQYQRGGHERDAFLVAVEAYHNDGEDWNAPQ